ncbi:MAG: cytochrome c3 family protein [Anaerolineaceae bacterium]|nr:cytochrome c3 family protein [Anaerolineaceae bacterium]
MKCHETFHTYKPGTDWKNVVPDCTTCHSQFHGDNLLDCTRCHENAHAPKVSLNFAKMATDCSVCHPDQKTEAVLNPSAHTDKACFACHHDLHGYIPSCAECHRKPHTPFTKNAECNACHPSHSPLVVSYTENTADAICKGCHADVGNKLSSSDNRHAFLKCAFCHSDKHRYIPICQDCHGLEPHAKELLEKFSGCKDCHGDAHTLTSREP